ncbi:MAG: hypothetical protein V4633_21415, partial [Pseudomonadota bacterium]
MLELINTSLRLAVTPQGLTLARTRRWGGEGFTVLAEQALSPGELLAPERLLTTLHSMAQGQVRAGLALHVVLADELTRMWQITPPQGAARLADLEAACALRFYTLYGEPLTGWRMAADWNADAPFFAAALPAPMFGALEQFAATEKLRLVSAAPQFVHAWNRWSKHLDAGAWFAVVQGERVSFGVNDARRLQAVRSLALPAGADLAWLEQQCAREALRLNVEAPSRIQVCGQAPQAWLDNASAALRCERLDQARRGLAPLSSG